MFKKMYLDIKYTKTYSYAYDNIRFFEILLYTIQRNTTNEIRIVIEGTSGCIWFSLLTYCTHNKGLNWEQARNSIRFDINELYCLNNTIKKAIKIFTETQNESINLPKVLKTIKMKDNTRKIQILVKKHKNKLYLDFRIYITRDNGLTWKPTKDGICLYPNELLDLQSTIKKAIIISKKEKYFQNPLFYIKSVW